MTKEDFSFEFDESVLYSYAGKTIEKKLKDPKNGGLLEEIKEQFYNFVQPKVFWQRFSIEGFKHEKVLLPNSVSIGNGPVAHVVSGAAELVVCVCTVGKMLEDTAKSLMKSGSMLKGIILDGLASWAVDNVRCSFYTWFSDHVKEHEGYRSSTYLSPGESVWSIDDQRVLFKLLAGEISGDEVTLTESNVMVPFKSLSMIFGIGPNKMGSEGESNCEVCTMKDVCKFRKLRAS